MSMYVAETCHVFITLTDDPLSPELFGNTKQITCIIRLPDTFSFRYWSCIKHLCHWDADVIPARFEFKSILHSKMKMLSLFIHRVIPNPYAVIYLFLFIFLNNLHRVFSDHRLTSNEKHNFLFQIKEYYTLWSTFHIDHFYISFWGLTACVTMNCCFIGGNNSNYFKLLLLYCFK